VACLWVTGGMPRFARQLHQELGTGQPSGYSRRPPPRCSWLLESAFFITSSMKSGSCKRKKRRSSSLSRSGDPMLAVHSRSQHTKANPSRNKTSWENGVSFTLGSPIALIFAPLNSTRSGCSSNRWSRNMDRFSNQSLSLSTRLVTALPK